MAALAHPLHLSNRLREPRFLAFADELIERSETGLKVTDLGRLLIRNIAMRFDAYAGERKEARFSKTI